MPTASEELFDMQIVCRRDSGSKYAANPEHAQYPRILPPTYKVPNGLASGVGRAGVGQGRVESIIRSVRMVHRLVTVMKRIVPISGYLSECKHGASIQKFLHLLIMLLTMNPAVTEGRLLAWM